MLTVRLGVERQVVQSGQSHQQKFFALIDGFVADTTEQNIQDSLTAVVLWACDGELFSDCVVQAEIGNDADYLNMENNIAHKIEGKKI